MTTPLSPSDQKLRDALGKRNIVLVGMMGAGKTSIGKRLAERLHLPFLDSDSEVEKAAQKTISEIFAEHGEDYFRAGEKRVMARLLESGPQVISTGGGAFMNPDTRELAARSGISIWLKAEADLLLKRVRKRPTRPLLQTENPEATLKNLIAARTPTYQLATLTIESRDCPHEEMVEEVMSALAKYIISNTAS